MDRQQFTIKLMPEDEGGYSVIVPELPGCFTQGETLCKAIDMAKDAISLYIESMKQDD